MRLRIGVLAFLALWPAALPAQQPAPSQAEEGAVIEQSRTSLRFGRVAGSVIVLCRLGRITADEARAILVAGDDRRSNIGRLWDRFSVTYLKNE